MMASPEQKRAKLQAAAVYVDEHKRAGVPAEQILAGLVEHHGARLRPHWQTNRLSCAGVTSTCTYSAGAPLLDNWKLTATVRLMAQAMDRVA